MGAKTMFSASESAQAMEYMAMAGWKTEQMLDGIAPVFPTYIREARKAARHMRAHGVGASEYFVASQEATPWYEAPPGEESFARNAAGLANDYWEVTREVLSTLTQRIASRPLTPVGS